MASSCSSLDTPSSTSFTFSTQQPFMTTSFSDLIAPPSSSPPIDNNLGSSERPQGLFKSMPPPSLPLSPLSPSYYFAIPAGLSPAELLDSPVLLSSSNVKFSCRIPILFMRFCFFLFLGPVDCVWFLRKSLNVGKWNGIWFDFETFFYCYLNLGFDHWLHNIHILEVVFVIDLV